MFERSTRRPLAELSDNLAAELFSQKKYREAIWQTNITNSLIGKVSPVSLKNIAVCHSFLLEPAEAMVAFNRYMNLSKSRSKEDIRQMSQYLNNAGCIQDGYEYTLKNQHNCSEKWLDLGWYAYRNKDYTTAFEYMERGREMGNIVWVGKEKYDNLPNCPRWQGELLENARVLCVAEGGMGDEFIFSRWLPVLWHRDGHDCEFDYYTTNTLSNVITRNFPVAKYDKSKKYDYWFPMMSLPYLLNETKIDIHTSYITPSDKYVEKWKKILGNKQIAALSWKGSNTFAENHFRDIDVDYLVKKLDNRFTLVSVCKEADTCPGGVLDLTDQIECWDDTLAILSLSEMVFCSCSSVAHAAGSLGVKTVVYTRPDDYFTWGGTESGKKTDWYTDVTVWRTNHIGKWQDVITASVDQLQTQTKKGLS